MFANMASLGGIVVGAMKTFYSPGHAANSFVSILLLVVGCVSSTSTVRAGGLTCPAAIISSGTLSPAGNTSVRAYWGPVWADGDLRLLDWSVSVVGGGVPRIDVDLNTKATGAGIDYDSNVNLPGGKEQWLRWRCSGTIMRGGGGGGTPLFPTTGINGVQVIDFYTQLMNGEIPNYSSSNVNLLGRYSPTTVAGGEGLLYDAPVGGVYTTGTGALVQKWPEVSTEIHDYLTGRFSYVLWKQTAIDRGYYVRPTSTTDATNYVNQNGGLLYVRTAGTTTPMAELTTVAAGNTLLTDLGQISMIGYVPEDLNTAGIPDRILFIDTVQGTENGTHGTTRLSSGSGFFWKGAVYCCGNMDFAGAGGAPDVRMKNPLEYAADPDGHFHWDHTAELRSRRHPLRRGQLHGYR